MDYKFKKITFVRKDSDPEEAYVDTIIVREDIDIELAIKAASEEFLCTKEGLRYLQDTNGCFNYGDAITRIPDAITQKYHYTVLPSEDYSVVTVDQNDHLVPHFLDLNDCYLCADCETCKTIGTKCPKKGE